MDDGSDFDGDDYHDDDDDEDEDDSIGIKEGKQACCVSSSCYVSVCWELICLSFVPSLSRPTETVQNGQVELFVLTWG